MLAALEEYKRDIIKFMDRDISRRFENLSSIKLQITIDSIAIQLRNIMVEEQKVNPLIKVGPQTKYTKVVRANWGKVRTDAETYFGKQNVALIPNKGIEIRLWDAGNTKIKTAGYAAYNSFLDVQKRAIPQFKNTFKKLLEQIVGKQRVKNITHIDLLNPEYFAITDSFNQKFTLSHRQMTAGEQVSSALKNEVSRKSSDAKGAENLVKTQELKNYNIGKQNFYDATEIHMNSVMAAATFVQLGNNIKTVKVAGKRINVPGSFDIILTFDELEFNRAYGQKRFKKDINVLQKEWERWAEGALFNILSNASDVWELKGSSSRKESTEALMQRAVESHVVKARKNLVIKSKSGKAKKPKAKKQTTKAAPVGKKKKARTTKRATANKTKKQPKKQTARRGTGARLPAHSPVALTQLLNQALPKELQKNMTGVYPKSLEYRTGRFAQSAEVTSIVPFPRMTQIQYTYQKDPYQVFETDSGNPLASAGRDPRRIIGGTIREIAQEIMGEKFGLVRTKRV